MFSKESKVPPVFEMLQHFPYFTVLEPVCTVSQLRYYCTICVPHGEFTIPMWVCVFPALFPFSSRRCSFQCPAYRQTSHFQLFACLMQVQGFICFRSFFLSFFSWLFHWACRILVPRPGINPRPPTAEAQSSSHWTAREFPAFCTDIKITAS